MPVDLDLRRFLRHRDEASFRELYRRCTPRLYGLALRLEAGRREAAEDLVQETWIRAVARLERFAGRSRLETWLCGVLVNCHRERLRRRTTRPHSAAAHVVEDAETVGKQVSPGDELSPVKHGPRQVQSLDLERAVRQLPEGYRQVLVLHDVFGHTHREISRLLGIQVGTSKSQLARARQQVRASLGVQPASGASGAETEAPAN